MGAAIYGTLYGVAALATGLQHTHIVVFIALQLTAASLVGGLVYLAATIGFGLSEPRHFLAKVFRRSGA